MQEYIEIGKIVSTHGVAGMVRIQPWCDKPEDFVAFKTLYLSDHSVKTPIQLSSAKPHGNVIIAKLKGIDSLEQAENYRNRILYAARKDIHLPPDRYLICDLIGCEVYHADSGELLGKLTDVTETGANDVWHIKSGQNTYLVPCIDEVVCTVDPENNKITIRPLDGIFNA